MRTGRTAPGSGKQGGIADRGAPARARGGVRRNSETAERFRLAQEALGFVTWVWDLERDRVHWRGNVAQLLGLPPGRTPGRFEDYLNCLHPDDLAHARSTYTACLKGMQPEFRAIERILWPDGSLRWLEIYGRGTYRADGRATRMAGVMKDVSAHKREESARASAELKYQALFDSSPEAITLLRLSDGMRLAANAAWERFTGYARDDAVGQPALARSLFQDPARRRELIARAETEGGFSNVEARLTRADGEERDALLSAVLIELDGERCILWTWRDVTADLALERERHAADERYRALFESTMDAIAVLSPDWKFIDVNPSALLLSGYAREEIVGQSIELVLDREELSRTPVSADRQWVLTERELTMKDGRKRPIEVMSGPLPDGKIIAVARDITERKRAESQLMNVARGVSTEVGEEFFRSLVHHLTRELGADFAYIGELVPPDNSTIRTLAFLEDGEFAPLPAEHPVEGSMSALPLARGATVVLLDRVTDLFPENADMRKEGVAAYVGTPLHGANGKALGVLAVGHRSPIESGQHWASMIEIFGARAGAEIERMRADAQVRRVNLSLEEKVRERTAELEDANRELDSFNYSVSHDLRQPLNAIGGFADLMREHLGGRADEAARQYAREIEVNAVRMEQMIRALLEFSRAGRGDLTRAAVDMRHQAETVARELEAGGGLRALISIGDLPPAPGDEMLLRQVWSNLIGNAVKYSAGSAPPRIDVRGERRDGSIEYSVRDNGIGFDMRDAGCLFGVFQRLPGAAAFEGAGVGLAIVERIVRRHGGHVSAESTPGQGAVIRFTLPA
jgi:PAS domain S-box-containing protein